MRERVSERSSRSGAGAALQVVAAAPALAHRRFLLGREAPPHAENRAAKFAQ